MTEQFTSDEIFEASEIGEPIMVNRRTARKWCDEHGADFNDFELDMCSIPAIVIREQFDAAEILAWLGY